MTITITIPIQSHVTAVTYPPFVSAACCPVVEEPMMACYEKQMVDYENCVAEKGE